MTIETDLENNYEYTHVAQVVNVAPSVTLDQLQTLFGHLGKVEEIKMYPTDDGSGNPKIAFVKFAEKETVGMAQHLTNVVFIDRALIVLPFYEDKIPEEVEALKILASSPGCGVPSLNLASKWPPNVVNQVQGVGPSQMIITIDPKLSTLNLPPYPPLPAAIDSNKLEEVRRTVFVGNLNPKVMPNDVMKYFSNIGEVKYLRMAGSEDASCKYAYIEFTEQTTVPLALQYNGALYNGWRIKYSLRFLLNQLKTIIQ